MPSIYSYKSHSVAYHINTATNCYTYLENSGFIEMTFNKVHINQENISLKRRSTKQAMTTFFSSSTYEGNHYTKLTSYKNENESLSH